MINMIWKSFVLKRSKIKVKTKLKTTIKLSYNLFQKYTLLNTFFEIKSHKYSIEQLDIQEIYLTSI